MNRIAAVELLKDYQSTKVSTIVNSGMVFGGGGVDCSVIYAEHSTVFLQLRTS